MFVNHSKRIMTYLHDLLFRETDYFLCNLTECDEKPYLILPSKRANVFVNHSKKENDIIATYVP